MIQAAIQPASVLVECLPVVSQEFTCTSGTDCCVKVLPNKALEGACEATAMGQPERDADAWRELFKDSRAVSRDDMPVWAFVHLTNQECRSVDTVQEARGVLGTSLS